MTTALGTKEAILEHYREYSTCQVCGRRAMVEFLTETSGVFTHHYEHGDLKRIDAGDLTALACSFTYNQPT